MNIVLSALLLALLLLPGILFRLAYLALPLSNRSLKSSFLEELVFSLIPALAFQIGGYALVEILGAGLDERKLLLLLLNSDKVVDGKVVGRAPGLPDFGGFFLYSVVLGFVAVVAGSGLRAMSKRFRWHLRYSAFRIYNEWEIYFDGYILDIPDQRGTHRQAEIVERGVDVMVQTSEGCFLYVGLLEKYVISKDEKLDRIYLSSVRRRKLSDDHIVAPNIVASEPMLSVEEAMIGEEIVSNPEELQQAVEAADDSHYYYMPGHYFMIPGSEIKNIHITYYFEREEEMD